MFETTHKGIRFIEGRPNRVKVLGPVSIEIGGILTSAQLKTLDDVKDLMASEARQCGANAIIDFKYGQRSVGFWAFLFQRDDVNWYGTGSAAIVS